MNGKIYQVTIDEIASLIPIDEPTAALAKLSQPLIAGFYGPELICIAGLVPPTLLSDQAYLWLITTDAVERHKVVFGRHVFREMKVLLALYPRIVGHCVTNKSKAWLRSLGATFDGDVFEIRSAV